MTSNIWSLCEWHEREVSVFYSKDWVHEVEHSGEEGQSLSKASETVEACYA